MLFANHALCGVAAGLATGPAVTHAHDGAPSSVAWVLVVAAGTALPDWDHRNSTITKVAGPLSKLVGAGIRSTSKHRGATHYAVTAVAVAILTVACTGPVWLGVALGLGMLVHDVGDCLTDRGVKMFWPLPTRIALGLLTTGQGIERHVLPLALVGACVAAGWSSGYWPL